MDLSRDTSIDRSLALAPGGLEGPPAVDLRNLFRKLRFYRRRILVVTILSAAAAYALAQQVEPDYIASTSVLLGGDAFTSDTEEAAQLALLDNQRIATAIEVLQSSGMLGDVADGLDEFGIDLAGPPEPGDLEPSLFERMSSMLGAGEEATDPVADDGAEAFLEEQRRRQVIETLRENLSVSRVEESSVISLSYISPDPEIPATVLNLLVDQYVAELQTARDRARRRQVEWLNQNLDELRAEIQAAERAVDERRAELSAETGQGLEIVQRALLSRADRLSEIQSEVARLSVLRDRLFFALGSDRPVQTIPEFSNSPVVQEIANDIRTLENRLRDLPEGNPARATLEDRIEARRNDIHEEARRIAEGVSQELVTARENERSLTAQVRELEDRVLQISSRQLELRELEREAEVRRKNYEALSGQLLNIVRRTELGPVPVQVISRADVPEELGGGAAIAALLFGTSGFLFAAGWVVLRDIFSNTFRSASELEHVSGTRVVGRIPRVRRHRPRQVLEQYVENPRSPLADGIRRLCMNLSHLGPQKKASAFLLAGPLGAEGASMLALLTAIQFQRMGQPTLLLDCSPTGETVNAALRRDPPEAGVQTVLTNASSLDEAIMKDAGTELSILSWHHSGVSSLTTSDAFQTEDFQKLLGELRGRYAKIILNAEPVLAAPDAMSLASDVDAVVLVVRWNRTPRMALMESIEELASVGRRPAGTALNIVDEKKARAATPWRARTYRASSRISS